MITADLLAGLALATLILGLDCITFLKEDPCVKLKMCFGAGVTLGAGSEWLGRLGNRHLMSHRELGAGSTPSAGLGEHGGVVFLTYCYF